MPKKFWFNNRFSSFFAISKINTTQSLNHGSPSIIYNVFERIFQLIHKLRLKNIFRTIFPCFNKYAKHRVRSPCVSYFDLIFSYKVKINKN